MYISITLYGDHKKFHMDLEQLRLNLALANNDTIIYIWGDT